VIGKFVGSALAAKFVGQNCMIVSTIGADEYAWFNGVNRFKYWFRTKSVNTRSIYNDVIMALVTTFMTGPALNLIGYILRIKKHVEAVESIEESNTEF
jgi:hypothetical protein